MSLTLDDLSPQARHNIHALFVPRFKACIARLGLALVFGSFTDDDIDTVQGLLRNARFIISGAKMAHSGELDSSLTTAERLLDTMMIDDGIAWDSNLIATLRDA
jgi:hypothetical protein